MAEDDGSDAGRYYVTVDESISRHWYIYVSSTTPAYYSWVALASIPTIAGSAAISIPVTTPSVIALVTGYWTCLSHLGVAESGVLVSLKIVDFSKKQAGLVLDETVRTATSGVDGLVQFTNLVPGATYEGWRGTSTKRFQVTIPLGATGSIPMGNIIGSE
jgi:hypothetical protein